MGVTVILLIYSPWGKRSGAHLNPSTTLTYFRLGKVEAPDAVFYILAQFVGGVIGVMISAVWWGELIANMDVRYAATVPGAKGIFVAFVAELAISFVLMTVILNASNSARVMRFTGILAGTLVATYISLEAPFSGMSMNPARTFASAFSGRIWDAIWIYFSAPPLGMLLAAELYVWRRGTQAVLCAKLYHTNDTRCIFNCSYKALFPKLTLKEISQ
jgi:aquaporin Z